MVRSKKRVSTRSYRTLKDVYGALRAVSPIRTISERLGVTPQGFRHKCVRMQFFTPDERDDTVAALDQMIARLEEMRRAVQGLPTRVD